MLDNIPYRSYWHFGELWHFDFSQNIWIKPGCLIGQEVRMKGLPLSFFVFPPLCLFVAFSLNRIVVFLSCPGSRYCLTKYFMVHSTPYLPTASYLLSKIRGSSFGGGGRKKIAGFSYCFYFKVSRRHPMHGNTGNLRRMLFICRGCTAGHLFIYLRLIYLVAAHSFLWFPALVSWRFPFRFVQKGKVQSGSVSWGRSLPNTNPPAPACADLERGALNGSIADPHVCFVRPGRERSGLTWGQQSLADLPEQRGNAFLKGTFSPLNGPNMVSV